MSGEALSADVIEAAIAWAVKLDYSDPTPETHRRFEQWLRADSQHALAWQRAHSLKDLGAQVPPKLVLDTLQTVQNRRRTRRVSRRNALNMLSLGGAGLAVAWLAREITPWQRLFADVSTRVGARRTLQLADGTTVALNTDSAVGIQFAERRVLRLRRGEIHVSTGADTGLRVRREFWVDTPFGRMQALGTRFVVRLEDERARVSVQEGAVELHPAAGEPTAVVHVGESRWLGEGGTFPVEPRAFAEDAWIDGVIVGRDIPLGDLLAELARHRGGYVICDPQVAQLRVSGAFQVDDTDAALSFLAKILPIRIAYFTRYFVRVGPPGETAS